MRRSLAALNAMLIVPLLATASTAGAGGHGTQAPCAPAPVGFVEENDSGVTDPGLHPAGDLDADGRGDALQLGEDSSLTAVRGHDGATLWTFGDEADTAYRAGDLDGIPGDDLIVWSSTVTPVGTGQHREYVVRGVSGVSGTILWTRSSHSLVNFSARHEGAISVLSAPTDLDGDGKRDLLLATHFMEADTAFTRTLFESMSGKDGQTLARYGAGIGTWYNPINGPSRQLPFAIVAPDLSGDCLPDVVVNASRLPLSAVQAYPGKGGAPLWHTEIQHEGNARVLEVTGAHLNGDETGDVLLSVGIPGNASSAGSQVELVALSGADASRLWTSIFPQNLSRLTLQPGARGSGDDVLLSGPFGRSFGTVGVVDGGTGAIRWKLSYVDAWPELVGDATGDGIEDVLVGYERCVQGCVPTEATLLSASDGSVVWTREAVEGEALVPFGDDLDGDGRDDLFAFRDGPGDAPSFYAPVSGLDGELLWKSYRRMDEVTSVLSVAPLDIRQEPGVDLLEGFRADDHPTGPAARPGTGAAPLWTR